MYMLSKGRASFNCKFLLSIKSENKDRIEKEQVKDKFPELTVDELAKKIQDKNRKPEKLGTCSICDKKNVPVLTCSICGREVCGSCAESELNAQFDPLTGEMSQIEQIVCIDCQDKM